MLLANY